MIGVVCALLFVKYALDFSLPYKPLYAVIVFLAVYNLIFYVFYNKISDKHQKPYLINIFANVQISLDLLCLAVLIHLSGGIENPFIFYFIFHMIIASILLSPMASYLQATYAVMLFLAMVISEFTGFIPHYCLEGFITATAHNNLMYVCGTSIVFMTTVYIAVYMTASISSVLKDRERSLYEANVQLQEKDKIKSEYVLRVNHDIKGSLAAIQSCIEPVTEKMVGSLNNTQDNLLSAAVSRTRHLIFFVNALLDITRLKLTKKLKMEPFSFPELIQIISQDILPRAQSKDITFTVTMSPSIGIINGIKVYIEDAIVNILANSVKYTSSGGSIKLDVEDLGSTIRIIVEDTGIGIPENELSHIFEEFYRAKNVKKIKKFGTGLGLSVAKEIIEKHNGSIKLESQEHKGTKIIIHLPK